MIKFELHNRSGMFIVTIKYEVASSEQCRAGGLYQKLALKGTAPMSNYCGYYHYHHKLSNFNLALLQMGTISQNILSIFMQKRIMYSQDNISRAFCILTPCKLGSVLFKSLLFWPVN